MTKETSVRLVVLCKPTPRNSARCWQGGGVDLVGLAGYEDKVSTWWALVALVSHPVELVRLAKFWRAHRKHGSFVMRSFKADGSSTLNEFKPGKGWVVTAAARQKYKSALSLSKAELDALRRRASIVDASNLRRGKS